MGIEGTEPAGGRKVALWQPWRRMPRLDLDAYLARLGIADPGPPSAAALRALHEAHVEHVAYEALEIQLGRPTSVDPYEAAARILERRRGGYCFHLNGAFSVLLDAL